MRCWPKAADDSHRSTPGDTREPQLRKGRVGDHHSGARRCAGRLHLHQHAREVARATAHVNDPLGRRRSVLAQCSQYAFGHHESGIREAVDKIRALGIGAEHVDELAIGGVAIARQQSVQGGAARLVQAEQQVASLAGAAGLERHDRGPAGVVGHQHGNAVHDWKGAALAAEYGGHDGSPLAHERVIVDQGQACATERTAQQREQGLVHGM